MHLLHEEKVGKYWNTLSENQVPSCEKEQIILSFYKRVREKVNSHEWTEEEFQHFEIIIKQMPIENFISFIEIYQTLLDLSILEVLKEFVGFRKNGLVLLKPSKQSVPEMIALTGKELISRIFHYARMPLTDKEKGPYNSVDEKLEAYQQILTEIRNPESGYDHLFYSTFQEWVNQYFQNDSLKKTILSYQTILLHRKEKRIYEDLIRISTSYAKRNDQLGNYIIEQKVKKYDFRLLEKKRRS